MKGYIYNRFRKSKKKETTETEFPFTLFSALLLGYITLCGTLWHLGYWSTFGFNYLEYAQLSDLFKSTIYPFFSRSWILLSLFIFAIGMSYGMLIFLRIQRRKTNRPVEEAIRYNYNQHSRDLMILDGFIYLAVSLGGMFLVTMGPRKATISIPLLFAGLGFILAKHKFLRKYFADDFLRTIFILCLTLFAGFNFTIAKQSATQAAAFFKYRRINEIKSDDAFIDTMLFHRPYLGATDKFTFVLINTDNVMVVSNDRIKYLILEDYTDPKNYKTWEEQ